MRSLLRFTFLTLFILSLLQNHPLQASEKQKKIAITQIVSHPSLDLIVQGIKDEIKNSSFATASILEENAHGQITTAIQIAQKIVSESPDIIIAVSTPSAQTLQKALIKSSIPLVFAGVTDPIGAYLIRNLDKPEGQITGTIDLPSAKDQVSLIQKMVPYVKTVGLIYNSSEANSAYQINLIKKALTDQKIKFVDASINKISDIQMTVMHLSSQVDALFVPNDNMIISGFQGLLKITQKANLPVFVSDPESVEQGATAGLANDQYQVGRETGRIVVQILSGIPVSDTPVKTATFSKIYTSQIK